MARKPQKKMPSPLGTETENQHHWNDLQQRRQSVVPNKADKQLVCQPSILLPETIVAKRKSVKLKKTVSAAKKRKCVKASAGFELIHAHNPGSFKQQLTQNTKCLQIALFFMEFIFQIKFFYVFCLLFFTEVCGVVSWPSYVV
jgi:hypothetical protein